MIHHAFLHNPRMWGKATCTHTSSPLTKFPSSTQFPPLVELGIGRQIKLLISAQERKLHLSRMFPKASFQRLICFVFIDWFWCLNFQVPLRLALAFWAMTLTARLLSPTLPSPRRRTQILVRIIALPTTSPTMPLPAPSITAFVGRSKGLPHAPVALAIHCLPLTPCCVGEPICG